MTSKTQFTQTPCPKIDPWDISASFELSLDPINPAMLNLETSWGCTKVDLTPAVKTAETITHLFLSPEAAPTSLQFNREDYGREGVEDGGVDCIHGDDLSRIISMTLLKDVTQLKEISDGMVYMWNGLTNLFEPWDLKTFATNTNSTLELHTGYINNLQSDVASLRNDLTLLTKRVTNLEARMTTAEANITNLLQRMTTAEDNINNIMNRLGAIENAIYNWSGDKSTPIARGNINAYGDPTNSNSHAKGIFTHSPNTNVTGDIYAA